MKAAVLHQYDESLSSEAFVEYKDVPDPKIESPTDVIIRIGGAGGLGHIGIQVLAALCAAEIIVVDRSDVALQLAKECGAHHVVKADGTEVALPRGRSSRADSCSVWWSNAAPICCAPRASLHSMARTAASFFRPST